MQMSAEGNLTAHVAVKIFYFKEFLSPSSKYILNTFKENTGIDRY
jgi:hypothetical protein